MTDTIPTDSQPPTDFDKARRLSRLLSLLFAVCFWAAIVFLVCLAAVVVWPELPHVVIMKKSVETIPGLPTRTGAYGVFLLFAVPSLFALHYARSVFRNFANGEVFATNTMLLIRKAALWLTIAGIVPPRPVI